MLRLWLRALLSRHVAPLRRPLPHRWRPRLEALEDRVTPTQAASLSAGMHLATPQFAQATLSSVGITPSVANPAFQQAGETLTATLSGASGTPAGTVDFLLDG